MIDIYFKPCDKRFKDRKIYLKKINTDLRKEEVIVLLKLAGAKIILDDSNENTYIYFYNLYDKQLKNIYDNIKNKKTKFCHAGGVYHIPPESDTMKKFKNLKINIKKFKK